MKRVSAPERTRERLRALIDGRLGTAPDRSNLVLLAAQLILEEALEGEVRDEIGRDRYERADGDASGYRNGYRTGRMKTAEGMVEYAAPQVRETAEPFVSGIRRRSRPETSASTGWCTCSSTASPSGFGPVRRASRFSRPGASASKGARSCCT